MRGKEDTYAKNSAAREMVRSTKARSRPSVIRNLMERMLSYRERVGVWV